MDDAECTYLVSLRRDADGPLEHFAVRGRWDEIERLVQDLAWLSWQAGFTPLDACGVEEFRRRHPGLLDCASTR